MKIHNNYLKDGKVTFYISIYFIKNIKKTTHYGSFFNMTQIIGFRLKT